MSTTTLQSTTPGEVMPEQLDLVRRTVAVGATEENLQLYLYDCKRRGIHPLDRYIHFSQRIDKRTGEQRYTPIVSVDFMRSQAAATGEYAGNEDPAFREGSQRPEAATVTVWRLVQGQRCSFTATARWAEYYPGDRAGTMWRQMPHTMLGKCAEALALRKGFPAELAGLYSSDGMDQAGRVSDVGGDQVDTQTGEVLEPPREHTPSGRPPTSVVVEPPPDGAIRVVSCDERLARNGSTYRLVTDQAGDRYFCWSQNVSEILEIAEKTGESVYVTTSASPDGKRVKIDTAELASQRGEPLPFEPPTEDSPPALKADDIPF